MRQRCSDPDRRDYSGIEVHPAWSDFATFLADMGERPEGMTLDRIDPSKGYAPSNCRWATPSQQATNRRDRVFYEYDGKLMLLTRWAEETGIPFSCLHKRIHKLGWSFERAVTTPSRNGVKA